MMKRSTVKQDLMRGPIKEGEIFYKEYGSYKADGNPNEVHIAVQVYKFRIIVGQFDTTAQVWGVVRDAFHSITVRISRCEFERAMEVNGEEAIISLIKGKFPGPKSIEAVSAFCRQHCLGFYIYEDGPTNQDLIRKYEN